MDIAPALLLATVLWQVIDFLKEVTHFDTEKSSVLTQLAAWAGGIIVVVLASHAMLFDSFAINGLTLTQLDGGSQVFLGLGIASFASSLVDVKQAIDGSDTSKKPPLTSP